MFDNLSSRLSDILKNVKGQGRLTEENLQATISDIKKSLIDADVALSVVQTFISSVKTQSLGKNVATHLNPGQAFIKILHQELVKALGSGSIELNLKTQPPAVILLAGLQGSGKTTTAAKLANYLIRNNKKKVMLASTDTYRPAAIEQLFTLAVQINTTCYKPEIDAKPTEIAKEALKQAQTSIMDVLIVDTAGRMHIDKELMDEIVNIHKILSPIETLFVVDSMTGQDAANTAKTFNDTLELSGIILSKTDGDNRGGAALSVSMVTKKPIKFIGVGEKINDFEQFHPDRIAGSILGMGDILSLIETAEKSVEQSKRKDLLKKTSKGKSFNFNDLRAQLQQVEQMGGLEQIMKKMPGMHGVSHNGLQSQGKNISKNVAIINSMTPKERKFPKLLDAGRKKRIASGSGTEVPEINRLIQQLANMQKMMKKFTKNNNMKKMLQSFKGGLP